MLKPPGRPAIAAVFTAAEHGVYPWSLHSVTLSLEEKGLQRHESQLAGDVPNACRPQAAGLLSELGCVEHLPPRPTFMNVAPV